VKRLDPIPSGRRVGPDRSQEGGVTMSKPTIVVAELLD
jgi:hypothetical protein